MKKTFEDLKKIDAIYGRLLGTEGFAQTKLGYAFRRFSEKNVVKVFTDFNATLQDMRIDNALTDEKTGALLYKEDGQSFQYGKEGLKTVLKRSAELTNEWNKKEFEVEPYICKDLGKIILDEEEKEILEGVIIDETTVADTSVPPTEEQTLTPVSTATSQE